MTYKVLIITRGSHLSLFFLKNEWRKPAMLLSDSCVFFIKALSEYENLPFNGARTNGFCG